MRYFIPATRSSAPRALMLIALGLTQGTSTPAAAQGFLDFLFGESKPRSRPAPVPRFAPAGQTFYFSNGTSLDSGYSPPMPQTMPRSGTYRTMCVRLCDGYYFPINYNTPSGYLHRDADSCSARCGAQARLFYYPTGGDDMSNAVDLSGSPYQSLKTAFLYRKKYDASCTCRPHPWTTAEKERHRRYANPQQAQFEGGTGTVAANPVPPPSGPEPLPNLPATKETQVASIAGIQPEPVERPSSEAIEPATNEQTEPADTTPLVRTESMFSSSPTDPRARRSNMPRRNQVRAPSAPDSVWSFFGPSKYVWPGDPQPRGR